MPPKVAKPKTRLSVRTRTGCQTCRQRKLKCDEGRPICGQCQKSHRECVRSEPITFRHHQNSSFANQGNDHNLDSFYKYKQTYSADDKKGFLPVPQQLTWVYVTDPTAEDTTGNESDPNLTAANDTYQQVAAHSLEALSTAAADQTTSYPPQGTAYYTAANPQNDTSSPEYGFVQSGNVNPTTTAAGSVIGIPALNTPAAAQANMNYFLANNLTNTETEPSLIDPNLEGAMGAGSAGHSGDNFKVEMHGENGQAQTEHEDTAESRLAITLRNYNELQA